MSNAMPLSSVRHRRGLFFAFFLTIALGATQSNQRDHSEYEAILRKAIAQWQQYTEKFQKCSGSYKTTTFEASTAGDVKKIIAEWSFRHLARPGYRLNEIDYTNPVQRIRDFSADGYNRRYAFNIFKKDLEQHWSIGSITTGGPDTEAATRLLNDRSVDIESGFLCLPVRVPLLAIDWCSESLKIRCTSSPQQSVDALWEFEFTTASSSFADALRKEFESLRPQLQNLRRVVLRLNAKDFLPVNASCEYYFEGRGDFYYTVVWHRNDVGDFHLEGYRYIQSNAKSVPFGMDVTLERILFEMPAAEEFTLSAFGLPEPVTPSGRAWLFYAVGILSGIGLIVIWAVSRARR